MKKQTIGIFWKWAAVSLLALLLTLLLVGCDDTSGNHKITFEVNGEVYDTASVSTVGDLELPPEPVVDGYVFRGWFLDKDTFGQPFRAEDYAQGLTGDLTLYAFMADKDYKPSYTVTYDYGNGEQETATVKEGDHLTRPEKTVEWMYVSGWCTDQALTQPWLFGEGTVTGDVTLYAVWQEKTFIAQFFDGNALLREVTFTKSDQSIQPPVLPTRYGHTSAWNKPVTVTPEDMLYNVVYTPKRFALTYENLSGAENPNPADYGYSATYSIPLQPLSSTHARFVTWLLNGEPVTAIPEGSHGSLTLTAKWEPFPVQITYVGVNPAEHSNPVTYGQSDGSVTLTPATRAWYRFEGWYADPSYQIPVISLETTITVDTTLYAKWAVQDYTAYYMNGEEIFDTVTFNVNNKTWDAPPPPAKTGYSAQWETVEVLPQALYIYPTYTPKIYNITYTGISVGDTNENPATFTVLDGGKALNQPTRRGYRFTGWLYNGTPVTAIPSGVADHITLVAGFEAITYTITYLGTNGANISGLPTTYTVASPTITFPTDLTVNGCSFTGWTAEGEPVTGIPAGSMGNVTVTANWRYVTYTITYSGLAVGDTNQNPGSFTIADGGLTLAEPVRRGYRFNGWTYNGTPVTAIPSGVAEDITLVAGFTVITYRITYEDTHTADISALPTTYTVNSEAITFPVSLALNGCRFTGWTFAGAPITGIPAGSVGDVTVTAHWEYVTYQITYGGMMPTDVNGNPATFTVADGGKTLLSPSRLGYTFKGWLYGGSPVDKIPTGVAENITLTATWELIQYRITYLNTKGADMSAFPTIYTIAEGVASIPDLVPAGGYKFGGWLNGQGQIVTSIAQGNTGDITLTASFVPTPYIITLHPMGGTLAGKSQTVNFDTPYTLPVPQKEGFVFLGWFTNTGATGEALTNAQGTSLAPYSFGFDKVFYAQYAPLKCTVTFAPNGGSAVQRAEYNYGEYFRPKDHLTANGEGMYFAGWMAEGSVYYTESTQILANVVLTAQWVDSQPISTREEFLAIAQNPAGTYHLTCDISFSGETLTPFAEFSGVLDGGGHTLKGFSMSNTSSGRFAIFLQNTGTIKNLNIDSFTYTISHSVGAVTSTFGVLTATNSGTLENCSVKSDGVIKISYENSYCGVITANTNFGVLAGGNDGLILGCSNYASFEFNGKSRQITHAGDWDTALTAVFNVGGLVGCNGHTGRVRSSFSEHKATIIGTAYLSNAEWEWKDLYAYVWVRAGGAIGINYGSCNACYASADITLSHSTGAGGATNTNAGGFVGHNLGLIESSFSMGSLQGGFSSSTCLGGFVGYSSKESEASVIRGCHSGAVIRRTSGSGSAGGFAGENDGKIMNSYATGSVYAASGGNVGGFVGYNHNGATITQSFAGSNVTKYSGGQGFFVGGNAATGVIFKCYYLDGATLQINGTYLMHKTENGDILAKTYIELWSEELLLDTLEWGDDKWVILFDETPVLQWEMDIGHTYEITVVEPTCIDIGYSIYRCTHCARLFVRDFVEARGHKLDEESAVVVAPTCTTEGYTSVICFDCPHDKREHRVDIQPATGHTKGALLRKTDPTCTDFGVAVYQCTVCGAEMEETLPATGHAEYYTKYYTRPECKDLGDGTYLEKNGQTEEVSCSVCHAVLLESKMIEAHQFVLVSTVTDATCDTDGEGLFRCEHENCGKEENRVIEKLNHPDINNDRCCDVCRQFLDRPSVNFIEIRSVQDFLDIVRNPTAEYKLMCDLDFAGITFTPIGTQLNPFTGYFDGNGFKIKNISFTNAAVGGVFGYNNGVIRDLTVEGITLVFENSYGDFGGIAAYNKGYISGCKVAGSFNVLVVSSLTVNEYQNIDVKRDAKFGGLVGINEVTGKVSDCTVTAKIQFIAQNNTDVQTFWTPFALFAREYQKTFRSSLYVSFGIVAGTNSGFINNTRVALTDNFSYKISMKNTDSPGKIGQAYIHVDLNLATVAVANYGEIVNSGGTVTGACADWMMDVTEIPVYIFFKKHIMWSAHYQIDFTFDGVTVQPAESFTRTV